MRDRDVRNAIQAALAATGEFDAGAVYLSGLPEDYGTGASAIAAAAIEPASSTIADDWNLTGGEGLAVRSQVVITLLYRDEDPVLRDEGVELLLDVAANALNGQNLAGMTLPGLTRFASWQWQKPTAPERRITAPFTYTYLVDGFGSFDTSP